MCAVQCGMACLGEARSDIKDVAIFCGKNEAVETKETQRSCVLFCFLAQPRAQPCFQMPSVCRDYGPKSCKVLLTVCSDGG